MFSTLKQIFGKRLHCSQQGIKMEQKYSWLKNDLAFFFSVETGLTDEAIEGLYEKNVLGNPIHVEKLKEELLELFSDPDVDWLELAFNDHYEINMAEETPEDVRNFIIEHIWNKVFPDTPPPKSLK